MGLVILVKTLGKVAQLLLVTLIPETDQTSMYSDNLVIIDHRFAEIPMLYVVF